MPINREPAIYQGYVISQIGQSAGQPVEMEFKNAQNCVISGTHRWADDPTDMSLALQAEIKAREQAEADQVEADRIHNAKMKELRDGGAAPNKPTPPAFDVPADWREWHHFDKIKLAKQIEPTASKNLKKAEAEAIIEKWIAERDRIQEAAAAEAGNQDERPILGKDGETVSQEVLDKQKADEFVNELDEF